MIRLQDYTPDVYYSQSRDFQLLGRLFDVVLNSVKTNADLIYSLPYGDNSPEKTLDLLALTLGFSPKRKYSNQQLKYLYGAFPTILRNKGSGYAVELLINTLLSSEGITDEGAYELTASDDGSELSLRIFMPNTLSDTNLMYDILPYILPAGIKTQIIRATRIANEYSTEDGFTSSEVTIMHEEEVGDSKTSSERVSVVPTIDEIQKSTYSKATTEGKADAGYFTNATLLQFKEIEYPSISSIEEDEDGD